MITARRFALLALVIQILASPVRAGVSPPRIHPGDEELSTSVLGPFTARYAMSMKGNPWATAVIDLREIQVAGEPAYRHSFSLYFKEQTVFDETIVSRKSLAPVMKFIHGGLPPDLSYKTYTYQDLRLGGSQVFQDGRSPAPLAGELGERAFGAGTTSLVLAALPLAKGYAATIVVADDGGLHPDEIRVEAEETLAVPGGTFETWAVSAQGGKLKQWIAREPPFLIRMEAPEAGIQWELGEILRRRAIPGE